ncbi:type IV pilin N-terminal domain-containing protein [Haloarchaeobius sp. FL176]|uniref:type IV pilin N-terminal domain-containing protein n=1 Tax=Haloarchaeobius sp. FL176 TaxID=2967129 RepID=UPI002148CEBB
MNPARAVTPVVGIVLLLALTLVTSSVVAVGMLDLAAGQTASPQATFDATADASTGRVTITHRGGEAIDVDELELVVTVDGEELRWQPAVPFFSACGFVSGPTGPFNVAADQRWTAGESGSFVIAATNAPTPSARDVVVVTLVVEGRVVASVRSVATAQSVASSGSTLSLPASRSPAMSGSGSSSGSMLSLPAPRSPAMSCSGSSSGSMLSLPAPRSPAMSCSGSSAGPLATSSSSPGARATVVIATSGS